MFKRFKYGIFVIFAVVVALLTTYFSGESLQVTNTSFDDGVVPMYEMPRVFSIEDVFGGSR